MKNNKKIKYVGFGEYPTISQLNLCRKAVSEKVDKSDLYIYFKTSKGIKRRKLFDNSKP